MFSSTKGILVFLVVNFNGPQHGISLFLSFFLLLLSSFSSLLYVVQDIGNHTLISSCPTVSNGYSGLLVLWRLPILPYWAYKI